MADGFGVTVGILGILQRRVSVENAFHLGLVGCVLCSSQTALCTVSSLLAILVQEEIPEYLLVLLTARTHPVR